MFQWQKQVNGKKYFYSIWLARNITNLLEVYVRPFGDLVKPFFREARSFRRFSLQKKPRYCSRKEDLYTLDNILANRRVRVLITALGRSSTWI